MTRLATPLAIALAASGCKAPPAAQEPPPPPAAATEPALDAQAGTPIDPDGPDAAIAREEEAILLKAGQGEWVTRAVDPARRVATTALHELFPGYRFFRLSWQDRQVDPVRHPVSIAFGLFQITAVAPDGSRSRHSGYGNHESFGELLADARVEIRTEEQARRVWRAYCDLFRKSWTDACERGSATSWRLGVSDIGGRRYWYEVVVDADGRAVSGTLRVR